jgi:predicted DNA-binding transcriptional regulator AlpA
MEKKFDINVPLLTEEEVAEWLDLKKATLARWRWAGIGPTFIKLGGAVRYTRQDVQDYIDSNVRQCTGQSD